MRTLGRLLLAIAVLLSAVLPPTAHAWWNGDWTERTRLTLNTSATGLETRETVNGVAIAVRLHSGNFDFTAANVDGSDLRVIAGDDKTPLRFSVERFDSINELAVLWVQVPVVAPGTDKNVFYVYSSNPKAVSEATPGGGFDPATLAAIHFSDEEARGIDHNGAIQTADQIPIENHGLLAASARIGSTPLVWPPNDKVQIAVGSAATLALWLRLDALTDGTILQWGPLAINLRGERIAARLGRVELAGAGSDVKPGVWTQVAITVGGGRAALYVDGALVSQADMPAPPALSGELRVGDRVQGLLDELQIHSTARSADWLRVAGAAQGARSQLLTSTRESGQEADIGVHGGYFAILFYHLTLDGWIVIGMLVVMFLIAVWVMLSKAITVSLADRGNRRFLSRYRDAKDDLLMLHKSARNADSSLFRLYEAGVRELEKRNVGNGDHNPNGDRNPISGASIAAVKAAVDADMVRESQRLNSKMVLLTIAISGGPFLGLLGTVIGVMITFAAIAAAGDVNVNAIAPGIAGALMTTVVGLGVAIPSLFGYNYLASRIKNISIDMQVFVDEFISRVAEVYGAR